ncbi:hypothetical protein PVK06_043486 [Gossypium arboreum]|uniref:Uncharacterized protein n=1 Tax=Gossypium arboreum TaxID=29729 RepID=A0ABR0MNV4_GOSAR|nr:hypothetical protein PVK06_043486 [Gossypium arboreum]
MPRRSHHQLQPNMSTILHANADNNINVSTTFDNSIILSAIELCDTIQLSTDSVVNTPGITILLSGIEDVRWQRRRTPHSTMEEKHEDEDRARGEDEGDKDEESESQLIQINLSHNRHPPGCGTHSAKRHQ